MESGIAPYQQWGQLEQLSILDRKWGRKKMEDAINSVGDSVEESILQHLEKIDFETKRWKNSNIHCNNLKSKDECLRQIVELRKKILDTMLMEKNKIHGENDPEVIYILSDVFDFRLWNLSEFKLDTDEEIEASITELKQIFGDRIDKSPDMLIGEDIQN